MQVVDMQSRAVTRILVDLQTSIRPCYSQLWETWWLHNALDCPKCTSKLESRGPGTRIATQDAKIGVVNGAISSTESESEELDHFHFSHFPLPVRRV